jgi:hypothetical protein
MKNARNVKPAMLALMSALCAAPVAHGAMYKWTDADSGTATYSNQAPSEPDKVRDLTKLEGIGSTSSTAAGEALRSDIEKGSTVNTLSSNETSRLKNHEPAPSVGEAPSMAREPGIKQPGNAPVRPEQSSTRAPAKFTDRFRPDPVPAREDSMSVRRETENPPQPLARGATEAVRDPCLRSSDPRCYERNKASYHPYFGYAPSVLQGGPAPTGATAVAPAGGVVSGHVAREAPPRRADPMPTISSSLR